jgi:hypothetical protein
MTLHGSTPLGQMHVPYNWQYANAAARTGATGFVAADVGKLARQLDDNSIWQLTNHSPITWAQLGDTSGLAGLFATMSEPTGFPNRTDSTLAFTDGTRTFQIAPAVTSFDYYIAGTKYTKSAPETVIIPNTTGIHFVYYNGASLASTTVFSVALLTSYALVAAIYWNATEGYSVYFGDERHGVTMDGATHYHLHHSLSTVYLSGLALGDIIVDASGNLATSAQLSVGSGYIMDEDLIHTLATVAAPAQIPVLNLLGTGRWVKTSATTFPVRTTGTGRLAYNFYTGGNWTVAEVANNDFCLYHIFATNDPSMPYVSIMGQTDHATITAAREAAEEEIASIVQASLPFAELLALGTLIFETANSFSNSVKARIRSTITGADYVDWRTSRIRGTASPSDHGTLTGLDDPDHPLTAVRLNAGPGVATITNLDDAVRLSWSSGIVDGGALTDNGDGTIGLAAAEAMLRPTASDSDDLFVWAVPASTPVALTNNTTNYVYASYNSGIPVWAVGLTPPSGWDNVLAYVVVRIGTDLYHIDLRNSNIDAANKNVSKDMACRGPEHVLGGTATTEVGSLRIAVSAGEFFYGNTRFSHLAFDTSGTDTFTLIHSDGGSGWTYVSAQAALDPSYYDDGSGTPASLTSGTFGVHWLYLVLGASPELWVVMGQAEYADLGEAQRATVPTSLPPGLDAFGAGVLIAKIIAEDTATSFDDIQSPWEQLFLVTEGGGGGTGVHNDLTGIQGGTTGEYYHLTAAQHAAVLALIADGGGEGGSMAIYSNVRGDFRAVRTADTTVYIDNLPWPIESAQIKKVVHKETGSATEVTTWSRGAGLECEWEEDANDERAGTLTITGATIGATDELEVQIDGAEKAYDREMDAQKFVQRNPDSMRNRTLKLIGPDADEGETYYYVLPMVAEGYRNLGLVIAKDSDVTIAVAASNEEIHPLVDSSSWVDCTFEATGCIDLPDTGTTKNLEPLTVYWIRISITTVGTGTADVEVFATLSAL